MHISKVFLENFKCFDKIELDFGKLTILTGANSSGKSSIIYSVLSAIQSGSFPFSYSINGKYIDMGGFEDVSYKHNKNNLIKIGFNVVDENRSSGDSRRQVEVITWWSFDKIRKQPKFHSLRANAEYYDLAIEYKNLKYHLQFNYYHDKDSISIEDKEFEYNLNKLIQDSIFKAEKKKSSGRNYFVKYEERVKRNNKRINFSVASVNDLYKAINEKGSQILSECYNTLMLSFNNLEQKTNYISSFRLNPQKFKFEVSKTNFKVSKHGENYEDQILSWEYNRSPELKSLISIAKRMKLLEDIKTNRVASGGYEMKIKTHRASVYSSLTDVGFGISQFLPVIVSDLQLGKNSTLFVSQPEIHLHPKIQSEFGDYVCDQINSNNKSYVLETHSEYLLNKLRLLIVKKKLKTEDVKVYYFKKNSDLVEKFELELTPKGEIKNAPADFFETYMVDVMNIALNS